MFGKTDFFLALLCSVLEMSTSMKKKNAAKSLEISFALLYSVNLIYFYSDKVRVYTKRFYLRKKQCIRGCCYCFQYTLYTKYKVLNNFLHA